jgi:ubiquinone/menaquinone biosynthesis C-methylase UbiE
MSRRPVCVVVILFAAALPGRAQEKSVRPGINEPFENPDVKGFLKKFEVESREIYAKRQEIVAACQLKPGMAVADVGAGTGLFTRLFGKAVGPRGKVFAVDIAPLFIRHIEKTCGDAGLKNVVGVVCSQISVKLPPESVDLVFVCDTYHHFEFPFKTMGSIHQALRPGGQVVLIDFRRIKGQSSDWIMNHVRAGQEVFVREIVSSGFKVVDEQKLLKENYLMRFAKVEKKSGVENAKPAPAPLVIRSARSGLWSAPSTWEGGRVPGAGDRVLVRAGHRVAYDICSTQVIRSINVAGSLAFAPDRDTLLTVGLIKLQAGEEYSEEGFDCDGHAEAVETPGPRPTLEVGTPDRPIAAKHTATIRLAYSDGLDRKSCPAIVCCGGRMDFHGAPLSRTWVRLGADARPGDTGITLAEPVSGWRIGDRILVTATQKDDREMGTRRPGKGNRKTFTEERTIKGIDGTRLTLDQPLKVAHAGGGEYRGEVANLSRNVVIESADPAQARGHTMYHRDSAGSISFAEFRHLGMEGALGRYPIHFHLCGDSMRGSSVIGASIWDSGNRWLTIHGTSYLVVRDCVGYQSVGHGFFLEDGTEVYNVLDRNLAVQAYRGKPLPKQALPFDANEGAGFWWANSLNTFTRNVTCENDRYGYRFEATAGSNFNPALPVLQPDGSRKRVDIRTLPFVRFDDNEGHCDGLYGFNLGEGVNRVGPDQHHPFIIRRLKLWQVHYAFRPQSPSVLVEDLTIDRSVYGVYHPHYEHHVYKNVTINGDGSEPFNRGHDDFSIQYGPLTVDGLTFTHVRGYPHSVPLIQISDNNPTGKAVSHIRNVKVMRQGDTRRPVVDLGGGARVKPETAHGVPIFLHDHFGPGRHAKASAVNAPDYGADGLKYQAEAPFTGREAKLAEVKDVAFPTLLDPVDDLPPATVITHVRREKDGRVTVRGTTSDNGVVKRVVVNGREARALAGNFGEWEVVVEGVASGDVRLEAHAEDAAGNVERRGHSLIVP